MRQLFRRKAVAGGIARIWWQAKNILVITENL
jgi:hypothetical protein